MIPQWRRLVVDEREVCRRCAAAEEPAAVRLLLLPAEFNPAGETWAELVQHSRQHCAGRTLDFRLADYWPDYVEKLAADLETAHADGVSVCLWDQADAVVLIGYACVPRDAAPWCDTRRQFSSAQAALSSRVASLQ